MGLIVLTVQFGTPQLLGLQRHAVVPLSITITELVRVHSQERDIQMPPKSK